MERLAILTLLAACSGDEPAPEPAESGTSGDTALGEGTLAVTFAMDPDYVEAMAAGEEPVGPFWGSIYLASDVSSIGPEEGAEPLASIEVAEVDMRPDGTATGVLHTTGPLPATEVVILGFVDTDANADPQDPGPDSRDPVTVPGDNDFDVVAGAETQVQVWFGLLNP